MLLKVLPAFVEQRFINVNHLDGSTSKEIVPNLNRLRVMPSTIEICNNLIEDVGCRHK